MDIEDRLRALQSNLQAHEGAAGTMTAEQVCDLMDGMGDRWREAWQHLPRDMSFDKLYALRAGLPDEAPRPFLFRALEGVEKHAVIWYSEDDKMWVPFKGPEDIIEWLLDNPPWPDYEAIADLYRHSLHINRIASPWILMMTLIGKRQLLLDAKYGGMYAADADGPVGIDTLIPVGDNDASELGKALVVFGGGDTNEMAREYIYLIDNYSSHIGGSSG